MRETLALNVGPQHPATHGTLRLKLEVDGEVIVRCEPEIGFLHTGFEKLAEHMTFNQFVTVTDRMNYLSPLCNNIGFVLAVEEALGLEVPPRCQWTRVILAELSRIADHILAVGLAAMDLGAFSAMLWAFIERESLYDLFELVTGTRLTTGFTRVGGMLWDLPDDFTPRVRAFVEHCPETLADMERVLERNRIWLDRTRGVGAVDAATLVGFGVTGPILRAAGVAYDLRRAHPYLTYGELEFDVPTQADGDVFARYRQRLDEIRESLSIVRQALERLPGGPINADDQKVVLPPKDPRTNRPATMEALIMHFKQIMDDHGIETPAGREFYSATESPNGELGFYLVFSGGGRPHRVRVRPPSFINYQAFPAMVEGVLLPDLVATLASLNVIAGELDR